MYDSGCRSGYDIRILVLLLDSVGFAAGFGCRVSAFFHGSARSLD